MNAKLGLAGGSESFLASMGIYVFNRSIIRDLLDNPLSDFGKHIIPHAINTHRVFSYVFQGYWEDIGTIRNFFEANLDLTQRTAALQFLRHERAHLFPPALSARFQNQRRAH